MPKIKKDHIPGSMIGRSAPKENIQPWSEEFWERMRHLPLHPTAEDPGIVLTPEVLWALATDYFMVGTKTTMEKMDFIRSGESAGKTVSVPVVRPYSWTSFGLYLLFRGVRRCVDDIRLNTDNAFTEFIPVVQQINSVIYQQKFDRAAMGDYNPHLIIRDLGLADKTDVKLQQEQPLFVDTPQPPVEE